MYGLPTKEIFNICVEIQLGIYVCVSKGIELYEIIIRSEWINSDDLNIIKLYFNTYLIITCYVFLDL